MFHVIIIFIHRYISTLLLALLTLARDEAVTKYVYTRKLGFDIKSLRAIIQARRQESKLFIFPQIMCMRSFRGRPSCLPKFVENERDATQLYRYLEEGGVNSFSLMSYS